MIIGTAGHVDHGKTALVKALTGVDTDRLPEEKRRGITLELGFAHLDLPDGRRLGVVDVPGHERFVKAMAAGAGGIDLALLVVAADEGVMPQTREHVDICSLLGVRAGVLVVTKADLLPGLGEGWLELLEADLRALTAGTFLEGATLVKVSARTGEGLDALKAELARLAQEEAGSRLPAPGSRREAAKAGASASRAGAERSQPVQPEPVEGSAPGSRGRADAGHRRQSVQPEPVEGSAARTSPSAGPGRAGAARGAARTDAAGTAHPPPLTRGEAGARDEPGAPRPASGPLFLPIDRAFTVKGFGCVVTGTLLSGRVALADELALLPGLPGPWRLRGLQVHGRAVEAAPAGERVALNLVGVETADVRRGMAVTRAGELQPAKSLDVELVLLPSVEAPLARRTRQLLTVGTAQVEAVVQLLDVDALRPGERCFAQLRLGEPVAALPQQRFILRGTKAVAGRGATLGGGRVLALNAPRRRRGASQKLAALAGADLDARLTWLLTEAGYAGLTEPELFARASAAPKELARALDTASAKGRVALVDKEARRFLSQDVVLALQARAAAHLEAFHAAFPEKDGMPKEELRQRLGVPHERTFSRVLAALVESRRAEAGELVRLPGRGRAFTQAAAGQKGALAALLAKAGLAPPTLAEAASALRLPEARVGELLKALVAEGAAVKASDLHFDAAAVNALQAKLLAHLEARGSITTQEFKELTGLTRKFLIPLAEYFDAQKVTLRVGDRRTARKR